MKRLTSIYTDTEHERLNAPNNDYSRHFHKFEAVERIKGEQLKGGVDVPVSVWERLGKPSEIKVTFSTLK